MASSGSGDGDLCPDPGPTTLLLLPLVFSLVWILLDIFYSSSLLGWAVTRVATFFLTDSAIILGNSIPTTSPYYLHVVRTCVYALQEAFK